MTDEEIKQYRNSDEFQYERLEVIFKFVSLSAENVLKHYGLNDHSELTKAEKDGKVGHTFDDGWMLSQLSLSLYVLDILRPALKNHSGYQGWVAGKDKRLIARNDNTETGAS